MQCLGYMNRFWCRVADRDEEGGRGAPIPLDGTEEYLGKCIPIGNSPSAREKGKNRESPKIAENGLFRENENPPPDDPTEKEIGICVKPFKKETLHSI